MENFTWLTTIRFTLLLLLLAAAPLSASAAEPNVTTNAVAAPATNAPSAISLDTERQLRSYLKLQEQLHATLMAIEQARAEASLEAKTNAELLASRLEQLEQKLAEQREQQLQASKASSLTALWIGGGIVALGLIALALSMYFQTRGVNRLAQVADGFQNDRALLGAGLPMGLSGSERLLIGPGSSSAGNKTLLATIDRLERRVLELEGATASEMTLDAEVADGKSRRNGNASRKPADQTTVLLSKGNVLLSLGKADEALACFDDAIAASPNLAEAQLKRGMALEKLKRLDDAVRAYDRAIALNKSLTQAYLSKGAIFNQQERFNDALECYEQALRSETGATSR